MCDDHISRSQLAQPAVDNLLVDYVVADNVVDGHPLLKFVVQKLHAVSICENSIGRQVDVTLRAALAVLREK